MLRTLLKVRTAALKDSLFLRSRKSQTKVGTGKMILLGVLMVYVVVVLMGALGLLFAALGQNLMAYGMTDLFFTLVGVMSITVGFVISIFTAKSLLYEAKDNELLLSMPIKPSAILGSRILLLLILEVCYSLLIVAPALVVYFLFGTPSVWGVAAIVLGTVFLSFFTVSLASLVGCFIGWVSSKIRFKNLVSVVLMIAFFGLYLYGYSQLQGILTSLLENGVAIGAALSKVFPPAYYFGAAVAGDGLALVFLLLWCAVPFAIAWVVLSKLFLRIATANKGERRVAYRAKALKQSSALHAMIRKELRRISSMPIYMMNCCIGVFFHLLLAGMLIFKGPEVIALSDLDPTMAELVGLLPYIMVAAGAFCATFNCTTAPSLSLEGNNLWILKSMPVRPATIYLGKILTGILISLPSLLILMGVTIFVIPATPIQILWLFLLPVEAQIFVSVFGMTANIWTPRFDWISPAVVIKQSLSTTLGIFVPMAAFALPVILYATVLNTLVPPDLFMVLCAVYVAVLTGVCWIYIRGAGSKKFDTM